MAVENVNYCSDLINHSFSLLIYSRKDTFPVNSIMAMDWLPAVTLTFFKLFSIKKKSVSNSLLQCSCASMEE